MKKVKDITPKLFLKFFIALTFALPQNALANASRCQKASLDFFEKILVNKLLDKKDLDLSPVEGLEVYSGDAFLRMVTDVENYAELTPGAKTTGLVKCVFCSGYTQSLQKTDQRTCNGCGAGFNGESSITSIPYYRKNGKIYFPPAFVVKDGQRKSIYVNSKETQWQCSSCETITKAELKTCSNCGDSRAMQGAAKNPHNPYDARHISFGYLKAIADAKVDLYITVGQKIQVRPKKFIKRIIRDLEEQQKTPTADTMIDLTNYVPKLKEEQRQTDQMAKLKEENRLRRKLEYERSGGTKDANWTTGHRTGEDLAAQQALGQKKKDQREARLQRKGKSEPQRESKPENFKEWLNAKYVSLRARIKTRHIVATVMIPLMGGLAYHLLSAEYATSSVKVIETQQEVKMIDNNLAKREIENSEAVVNPGEVGVFKFEDFKMEPVPGMGGREDFTAKGFQFIVVEYKDMNGNIQRTSVPTNIIGEFFVEIKPGQVIKMEAIEGIFVD